jgi:hypothetical protein
VAFSRSRPEDVPDGCLAPLADAVERELSPPYSAEAARHESRVWAVGANRVAIAVLPADLDGDAIEQTMYEGEGRCEIDGRAYPPLPALAAIGARHGSDYALRARRLDDTTWVVESQPL